MLCLLLWLDFCRAERVLIRIFMDNQCRRGTEAFVQGNKLAQSLSSEGNWTTCWIRHSFRMLHVKMQRPGKTWENSGNRLCPPPTLRFYFALFEMETPPENGATVLRELMEFILLWHE